MILSLPNLMSTCHYDQKKPTPFEVLYWVNLYLRIEFCKLIVFTIKSKQSRSLINIIKLLIRNRAVIITRVSLTWQGIVLSLEYGSFWLRQCLTISYVPKLKDKHCRSSFWVSSPCTVAAKYWSLEWHPSTSWVAFLRLCLGLPWVTQPPSSLPNCLPSWAAQLPSWLPIWLLRLLLMLLVRCPLNPARIEPGQNLFWLGPFVLSGVEME